MSWNTLKKSFEGLRGGTFRKKRLKRLKKQNENRIINISSVEVDDVGRSPEKISRFVLSRPKLDVSMCRLDDNCSQTSGTIDYDRDLDTYVGDCTHVAARNKTLGLYNVRSPEKILATPKPKAKRKLEAVKSISFKSHFHDNECNVKLLEKTIVASSSDEDQPHNQSNMRQKTDDLNDTLIDDSSSNEPYSQINDSVIDVVPSPLEKINQLPTGAAPRISEEQNELTSLVNELRKDITPQKKLRCKKGGQLEQLNKALKRFESDNAFWQHERRCNIIPEGVTATVESIKKSYGATLIEYTENSRRRAICYVESKSLKNIQLGSSFEVDLPPSSYTIDNTKIYLACNKIMPR